MVDPDTSAFINFVANITSVAATCPSPATLQPLTSWGGLVAPVFTLSSPQLGQRRYPASNLPPLPSLSPLPSTTQLRHQQQQQPIMFDPGLLKIEPGVSLLLPKTPRQYCQQHHPRQQHLQQQHNLLPSAIQIKTEHVVKSGPLTPLLSKMILPNIKPMPFHLDNNNNKRTREDYTTSKLKQLKRYRESHNEGKKPSVPLF